MSKDINDPLVKRIAWGARHDAFDGPVDEALLRNWKLGISDKQSEEMLDSKVQSLLVKEAFGQLIPFRKPRLPRGDFIIGHDTDREPLHLHTQLLNAGLLTAGNTGSAKTNTIKQLILGVAQMLDGLWCTDLYKRELRHLRPILSRVGRDFIITRARQLRINILQADAVDPYTHLSIVMDIFKRVLGMPPRALTILRIVLHQLYVEFGIFDGKTDAWPTIFDLYERIRSATGINLAAKEAIIDRLGSLLLALGPEVGAYRLAWRPSDLTRHFIDFELADAAEQAKSSLLTYFLQSELHRRVRQGIPNARISFFLIFEDAQRFVSSRGEDSGDITPLEELAGLIRGTGTGLAFTAQSVSSLPRGLMANLATKCMCRQGTHTDYQTLGADMGMTTEQIEWARLNLQPGLSIWSLAEGSHRHPFIVYTPKFHVPPVVDDAEADRSMNALRCLPSVPAPEFARWRPDSCIELEVVPLQANELTEAEARFLEAVVTQPGQPSSVYAKLSGMSGKRALEVRNRLIQLGYLRQHEVATGARGRNAQILEPLDAGIAALKPRAFRALP